MNRDQAYALVRETFTQSFDKARFRNFAINVLNRIDESKASQWNSQYVKDAFKPHVQRYERLGSYTSPEGEKLDVLIVHLAAASQLERARTAIRNFVAHHLKQRDEKDAALVAFVSPSEKQWRFSYVRMDYAAVEDGSGKVAVQTRLTPARRYSYIVGEGESCHTAQTRFLALLQDSEIDPKLADIEEAFSVEAVTREFFTKYVDLFEHIHKALERLSAKDKAIRDELRKKNADTVNLAKKLMGQVVFLYFLQKKGWLGVAKGSDWGTGPRDFLRRLSKGEYGTYSNFFNDILEPLFYDSLATDRGHEAWCKRFQCRIPFLNGGLFEPLRDYDWRKTDILLPNRLFTNDEFVEEGICGTGVLDVFDRYNFTVNEAEPLEKEVAIDPEMLGKVFEILIEDNRRKGLGAFYTPREIVHYMSQESLINYLDAALNDKDVLVPRADIETFVHIGDQASLYEAARISGTISYKSELPKSIETHARQIDEKLAEITICDPAVGSGAFPVGMMTEIVRCRCALSPYFNDVQERTPYHFKRHAIQKCLYGADIDVGAVEIAKLRLWLSLVVDEEQKTQIKPLPNLDFKIVTGNSLLGVQKNLFNVSLFNRLEELKPRYFDESDMTRKDTRRQEIESLIRQLTNGKEMFDFEIYFSEVFHLKGGFDIAIANPPYVSHDQITEDKSMLRRNFKSYSPFADLYCYFIERALMLLCPNGTLSFITSNSYLKAEYGDRLRSLLSERMVIRQVLNLERSQVFSDAIVNVAILIAEKRGSSDEKKSDYAIVNNSAWNSGSFEELIRTQSFRVPIEHFVGSQWGLERPEVLAVWRKIEDAGRTLSQLGAKIRLGIATGCNEAFIIDSTKRESLIRKHKASADIVVPVIRGRDIKRYGDIKPKLYLIAAENGVNVERDYPAIYGHLDSFGEEFRNRGAQGQSWWNLRACAFYREFDKPKIVWMELTDRARFTKCDEGVWCLNSAYFMIPPQGYSINYFLAILNSRVIYFYFKLLAQTSGMGVPRWIGLYVERFPIPDAPRGARQKLEDRVESILSQATTESRASTEIMEEEIDQIVYDLYGLTQEEITIVEKSINTQ